MRHIALVFARLILLAALSAPTLAHAQQPQQSQQTPEMQAIQSMLMEQMQARASWQAQAITQQAQIADLQKQLADAMTAPQRTNPK